MCSKFTGGHPCQSVISIRLFSIVIEITLRYVCSSANLLHIFRTAFYKNTSGGLLLDCISSITTTRSLSTIAANEGIIDQSQQITLSEKKIHLKKRTKYKAKEISLKRKKEINFVIRFSQQKFDFNLRKIATQVKSIKYSLHPRLFP